MRKSYLPIAAFIILFFIQSSPVFAVKEACSGKDGFPPDASCCTAPSIIEDMGGCPEGTVWIGGAATGKCDVPVFGPVESACPVGTKTFYCESNVCHKDPPPPDKLACSTPTVNTGSAGECCEQGQIVVRDEASATKWKCMDQVDPEKIQNVVNTLRQVIDVLNAIMNALGVNNTDVTNIYNALNNILNGDTGADYIEIIQKALQNFVSQYSSSGGGLGIYVGYTLDYYNGKRGGYKYANDICDAPGAFLGSHICSADEIINSYNNSVTALSSLSSEGAWINNGPPGYIVNVSNDCNGWKSEDGDVFGAIWKGGGINASYISPCDQDNTRRFACCK